MDSPEEPPEFSQVRHRDSPKRWTHVTKALSSPVRSIHADLNSPTSTRNGITAAHMESIDSQADFGHRTTDFFDDESTDEEANVLPGTAITMDDGKAKSIHSSSPKKKKRPPPSGSTLVSHCEPKSTTVLEDDTARQSQECQGIDSDLNQQIPNANTASVENSFDGSVEELDLLPGNSATHPSYPKSVRLSSGRTARSSKHESGWDNRTSTYSDRLDQRLGVHAFAYDMLLRGLYADEEVVRREGGFAPVASRASAIRESMLPPHLDLHDPRSPRNPVYAPNSAPLERDDSDKQKKVHLVPPPIDTRSRRSLPDGIARTPYPFSHDRIHRKGFEREPPSALESPAGIAESILTLSIRRANPNSKPRVTSITIPASNDFSAVRTTSKGEKQEQFKTSSFDDAEFFWQLRDAYKSLAGGMRYFSARSLKRITVSGPASRAADAGYGWLHQPRSPRVLAYRGLTDTFSEEKILQYYRKPTLGKSRYAFVHWAHRLSAAPSQQCSPRLSEGGSTQVSSPNLVRRSEQHEGLEFVVSWSVRRLLMALVLVIVLSIAATLLWIFLGTSTTPSWPAPSHAGFRHAGGRVGSGVLIGICVFLIGMSGIAGWVGVSWLVM